MQRVDERRVKGKSEIGVSFLRSHERTLAQCETIAVPVNGELESIISIPAKTVSFDDSPAIDHNRRLTLSLVPASEPIFELKAHFLTMIDATTASLVFY